MSQHRMAGFQKPLKPPHVKDVRLGVVTQDPPLVRCSCGWVYRHAREKIREDAVDRHLAKKHNSRGIRL